MNSDSKRVKYLIVDSGAFIKNSPVHEYAENIYTIDGAVKEIKDKATRQRLQILPYKLIIKEPSPENIKYVSEFAKKTGDYSNLSAVDLKILALTYELEKEYIGTDHLNKEPSCMVTSKPAQIDTNLSGFYYPRKISSKGNKESLKKCNKKDFLEEDIFENALSEISSDTDFESASDGEDHDNREAKNHGDGKEKDLDDEDLDEEDLEDEENEDLDADSWITPSNIAEVQKKMSELTVEQSPSVVACVSTDFSVQNVLIQMGLKVVSVDGMLIKRAKIFILRCHACFKTTNDNTKKFCPNCGNKTLKRVAVTVNEDGTKNIHINFNKPINIRGKRYSLPTPIGGKHAFNPILCEDQPTPQNRLPKAFMAKTNALHDDYEAQKSPFARNDVYSRAVHLGIHIKHHFEKRNPNANSKKTGNKKRK